MSRDIDVDFVRAMFQGRLWNSLAVEKCPYGDYFVIRATLDRKVIESVRHESYELASKVIPRNELTVARQERERGLRHERLALLSFRPAATRRRYRLGQTHLAAEAEPPTGQIMSGLLGKAVK